MGDLVPRDISEILAREGRAQRGQRKPGGSLGQAFSWFKGSRRKKSISNGPNRTGTGGTDVKLGFQNDDPVKAGSKGNEDQRRLAVLYTASQHYQENVFIEGSRPQYLEDLHTEAQEGLKILQQEENNGMNFPDDESIASTDTLQPEQDTSSKDRGSSPESGVSIGDSVTAVSAVSTRPVLTRQGSTFKPPNPVKRLDKGRRRSRRTTIMGIPSQVQRELALHRCSTFQQVAPTQLPNGDGQDSDGQTSAVIIPTINGETPVASQEGARVHLSDLEQATREEQLLRHHLHAIYQNEQPFSHQDFGSGLFPLSIQRPKSLAVPGMTTSSSSPCTMFTLLQEPQGPVMSISPQATYLSKIIPNAVLPASVEVIQIDRSSSQTRGSSSNHGGGSIRTVSKNSLTSGDSSVSPVLSRKSDGDDSHVENSHNSTPLPTSVSGSNWSQSRSSETIISNTSIISSKESTGSGNPQTVAITGQESQPVLPGGDQVHASLHSCISWVSSPSGKGQGTDSGVSGSATAGESMKNSQSFIRSLSVMKNKLPPAPPRRTNSLHSNKMRKNSRDLVDVKDLSDSVPGEVKASTKDVLSDDKGRLVTADITPASVSNSPRPNCLDDSTSAASSTTFTPSQGSSGGTGGPAEPQSESSSSSPQKTLSEGGKFERTMSPSSGYSSQSGTPILSPKGIPPTSPAKQKKKPVKPERSGSRASSSAASASSSLTSLSSTTSEPVNTDASASSPSPPQQGSPPSIAGAEKSIQVNSSSATHSIRELFNIPPPPKVKAPCAPPPETWAHNSHTFELLCGPCPNVNRQTQQQVLPQMKDSTVKKAETQTAVSKESQGLAEKQLILEKPVTQHSESKGSNFQEKPDTFLAPATESISQELKGKEHPSTEEERQAIPERMEANLEVQKEEQSGNPLDKDTKSQETMPKKDPPPVMKKTMLGLTDRQRQAMCGSVTTKVNLPEEPMTSSQAEVKILIDKSWVEMDRGEATSMQMLSTNAPKVSKVSPPPSPPPSYQPTPPPSRKTPPSSVSTPPPEELKDVQEEEAHIAESCWPPPPPPLEGDSVFDGVDEMDFPPPPPPPFVTDSLSDVMDICNTEMDDLGKPVVAVEEVGVTVKECTESEKGINGDNAEIPVVISQTLLDGTRPEEAFPGSKDDTIDIDNACRSLQNVSSLLEDVPPPPTEAPPPPPPVSLMAPSSSCLAAHSSVSLPSPVQIEDQTPPEPPVSSPLPPPISVPLAPPPPTDKQAPGGNFRRQPSLGNRDTRSKELLSRHKSAPIPKEDANIPLVTPSLLQMVRLRSVNMVEDQVKAPTEDSKPANGGVPAQEICPVSTLGSQRVPQKPIRKSLSIKSPPQMVKTSSVTLNAPSVRLQEAIRMKTAAMSSRDGLPSRLGVRSLANSGITEPGASSPKSPEGGDMHKSPASTASFIFSRSTKKVVIETPVASTPETQASLKQSLAAELMQVSDQSKSTAFPIGGVKVVKIPPPVAKKPVHGSTNPSQKPPPCLEKMELDIEANGAIGKVQPAGQNPLPLETRTTTLTSDTIETLF
ncbi:uncharacterized protein KIAA1522 homolog [Lampris incognitus]|uniref:uncharacterized protein KIAA1522 homolog n=1 Tax=Lampris incognitus TaxID=2546036 RepID=UPI0024B5E3F5|nr:uncharacterized protein KIAA1522 homolog [Lampris incognitus]